MSRRSSVRDDRQADPAQVKEDQGLSPDKEIGKLQSAQLTRPCPSLPFVARSITRYVRTRDAGAAPGSRSQQHPLHAPGNPPFGALGKDHAAPRSFASFFSHSRRFVSQRMRK